MLEPVIEGYILQSVFTLIDYYITYGSLAAYTMALSYIKLYLEPNLIARNTLKGSTFKEMVQKIQLGK